MEHIEQAGDHLESANNKKRHLMYTNWKVLLLPLSVFMLVSGLILAACGGSTTNYTWTTQPDFEAQNLTNNDTTTVPGELRLNYSQFYSNINRTTVPAVGISGTSSVINWIDLDTVNNRVLLVGAALSGLMYWDLNTNTTWRINTSGVYNITYNLSAGTLNSSTPCIPSTNVNHVAYDSNSNNTYVSIPSPGGLAVIEGNTSTSYMYNSSGVFNITMGGVQYNTVNALAFDNSSNLIYIGAQGTPSGVGQFGVYNRTDNVTYDLSATDPDDWISNNYSRDVNALAFDSTNNLIYLGIDGGKFGVYDRINNTVYDLSATDLAPTNDWMGAYDIYALAYDSNSIDNLVYLGGGSASKSLFGFYNHTNGTAYNLSTVDLGDWIGTSRINALAFDSTNNLVYIGANAGKFGFYNNTAGAAYNLSGTDTFPTANWIGTDNINALAFDSTNNLVYIGANAGKFGVYDLANNITYDLRLTALGNWTKNNNIVSLTFDSTNNLVYIGTARGMFGVYDRAANKTYDLSATATKDWLGMNSTTNIKALAFNSADSLLYIGGDYAKFGAYNLTSNVTSDLRGTVANAWLGPSQISSTPTINGDTSKFALTNGTHLFVATAATGLTIIDLTTNTSVTYNTTGKYNTTNVTRTPISGSPVLPSNSMWSLYLDNENHLLLMGMKTGFAGGFSILNLTSDTITTYLFNSTPTSILSNAVFYAWYDSNTNRAYVNTYNGTSVIDLATNTTIINYTWTSSPAGTPNVPYNHTVSWLDPATNILYIGQQGGSTSGTSGMVAVNLNTNTSTNYYNLSVSGTCTSLSGCNNVWSLKKDVRTGLLYLGMTAQGLFMINTVYDAIATMSNITDVGTNTSQRSISWSQSLSTGSNITVSVREGPTSTPDGSWTPYTNFSSVSSFASFIFNSSSNYQYIQWLVNLSTTNTTATPSLKELNVSIAGVGTCPCGTNITADTTLYADITGCAGNGLNITADNIVLDCNGHTISGTGANGIYAGTATNAYTNLTVKNCIISNFATSINASGASGDGTYNGGNVILVNSTITKLSNYGGYRTEYSAGSGGNAVITDSNVESVNSYGGRGLDNGGPGGSITITNSTVTTANSYGARGGEGVGGAGGSITITNSTVTTTNSSGGLSEMSCGGNAGAITITNSNVTTADSHGGEGSTCGGGSAGSITMTNSNVTTADVHGGNCASSIGGSGGIITATNSRVTNLLFYGGNCIDLSMHGGNAGNATIIGSELNLTNIFVNNTYGTGSSNGTIGTLKLNQTEIYTANGKIKFSYVSTNQTNFTNIMSISSNLITLDSATYPNYSVSANLTLYSVPVFSNPIILRNGVKCNSTTTPSCYNFTALNASTVIFNVSGFTNYSIGEGPVPSCESLPGWGCGYNLAQSCIMGSDLTGCSGNNDINISASAITLDCNGHTITGSYYSNGARIYGNGISNVTIKNCTAAIGTAFGIKILNSVNTTVTDCYARGIDAVRFQGGSYNRLINSDVGAGGGGVGLQMDGYGQAINSSIGGSVSVLGGNDMLLSNNTLYGPLYLSSNSRLIDQPVSDFNFAGGVANLTIAKTGIGQVNFLQSVSGSGSSLDSVVNISNNLVSVNSASYSGFNVSANLTLYGVGTFIDPAILRDGAKCDSTTTPSCYNSTSLNAGTVVFNVSGFTNYSIGEAPLACGDTITSDTNLTADLTGCAGNGLNIGADGITLDCQGHTISGTGSGYGINATTAGNAYTNLTIKNCVISSFASSVNASGANDNTGGNVNLINSTASVIDAYGGDYLSSNIGGNGGNVTVNDSYISQINNYGGLSNFAGSGARGGNVTVTNSNVSQNINSYGGNRSTLASGSTGGSITITNSNISGNVSSYGGLKASAGDGGSPAGSVTLINSRAENIFAYGGYHTGGTATVGRGKGGNVNLTGSNISGIYTYGGYDAAIGSDGGNVSMTNSNASDIYAYGADGGNCAGRCAGNGGVINIINSNISQNIRAYGGNALGSPASAAGNGGNVSMINCAINLATISINITRGINSGAGSNGSLGTLTLNNSGFYTSNGAINFNYISTQNTSFSSILSISSNLISLDSVNYPNYSVSANLTFYGTDGIGLTSKHPYRNGAMCDPSICTVLQDADTYIFNVTGFTNYSVGETDVPPVVNLQSPEDMATISATDSVANVTFIFNYTDDFSSTANCTLHINGGNNGTNASVLNDTATSITVTDIPAGSYSWNVTCIDNGGLQNSSSNRTFTIYNTTIYVSACQNLTYSGALYYLQSNITTSGTCINVTANNVTFDCAGHTIAGDGTGYGVNATTTGNAYTDLTVKNCNISNFATSINASGDVRSTSGTPYNGGNVTIENSNMAMIDVYGGKRITSFGIGGTGGNVNLINSNITTINAYGGIGNGATGGAGGNITITDSIITTANSYGVGGSGGGSPGGSGGKVVITNSNVTTADSHGGSGTAAVGGAGGIITITDSNVTTTNSYGGNGGAASGGVGGNITITDSIIATANSYGGSGSGMGSGRSGGNITITDSNLNLTNTAINASGGTGNTNGTAGKLTLNYSTSFADANSSYGSKIKLKIIHDGIGIIDFMNTELNASALGGKLSTNTSITNNYIFVDSASTNALNVSANITLYSPSPSGFPPYKVVRNGVECNSTTTPSCYNFTALNAATVMFNVSGFTNYSIMGLGVSGSSNVIAPPGVFEPYNASLSGTHVNTFGIKFVDLNIHSDETISCVVRQSNGALTTLNATGLSLVGMNYTLNYTITSGDSIINDPVAGYIPWELKNCTLTNASGVIFNQTINNRIYVHAPVYWSDSEVTRAVTCQGTPGVYFNNTAKCGFSGDTVFALQMRNGNSVEPSCFNNPGVGCSNSYCTGIYFPSCTSPSYFYGYNATSDDPNGYSSFTASFSGYNTPVAYTQYVNSSGTFKLRVTQALTAKPFSFTIYNLTNASNVGGASNVYGPNTGAGTLSVTDQGDGTWSVAYYRFSSFTGTLDFTFNISFTNTSLQQNRSAYLVIAYGTETNQGSPPYFAVNFSPSFGLRNANESENTSITTEFNGTCGDRVNNDFDYLGAGGSWTNSYDCYDPDCNNFLGDYSQTNEFGSGKTGLCNYGGEINCTDEFDNDYDGLTDCHDTDCFQNASMGCPVTETVCNDSINNDFDYTDASLLIEHNGSRYGVFGTTALTDCKDIDCNGLRGGNASQFCNYAYETNCSDGFNNDALQLADCNVSTLAGVTTMPSVANGEYDCVVYCRANVQSTETGALCDNNKDDDFDAVYVTGYYSGSANNTYGAGTDCRWLDYNPDENCNMTTLPSSGKRCELGKELTCNDTFDNDFDSYASSAARPSAGWNSSYYLATFNLTYTANADYADYDCRGASGSITNESQNASWCFDNVDNDLDAYYRTGDTWTLNSSTGVDCNDLDCLGVVNPANANQTCMKYEYNATDSFFTSLPNPGFYCTNGIDDDGDNWKGWSSGGTDCRDPDCNKKFDICTGPCYSTENIFWNTCKDSLDNDYDMPTGMTDCADTDCAGLIGSNTGAFCQATETICNDNFDNNANSLTDCADHSGCDSLQGGTVNGTAVYCRASESTVADCFDGFDNDADGAADCYDTGCNMACNLSTISGSSPITLPQWTGTTSINSVSNAYIRNYTNKIKRGDWYSITFTDTSASTNAQWTFGTASGARFTKASFNTATAILSGVSSGNFTLTETANGFIINSNSNSMPSGYNVTFAIQSTSILASSTYELTYIEESGAKTSLNNYITHEVVEDTSPTAQSIQVIPSSTGVPYGGTVYVRANASDDTGFGLCSWSVAGPPGESFTPADSTQCRGSFSPTVEGNYNITVTPKDYYSNTGTPLVKAYTMNILPTASSIQINRAVPFYNQSANDTVTINATFNAPATDSLGTCQVVVRSDSNAEILLESFAAVGNSCNKSGVNISSLGDGKYRVLVRVTETTDSNAVDSSSTALFVCSNVTSGACRYADYNSDGKADVCNTSVFFCGNGVIDIAYSEECDPGPPLQLAGQSCDSRITGYIGTLGCTSTCTFDTSACSPPAPQQTLPMSISAGAGCDGENINLTVTSTGSPVSGVSIRVSRGGIYLGYVYTGNDGKVTYTSPLGVSGTYTFEASKSGYTSASALAGVTICPRVVSYTTQSKLLCSMTGGCRVKVYLTLTGTIQTGTAANISISSLSGIINPASISIADRNGNSLSSVKDANIIRITSVPSEGFVLDATTNISTSIKQQNAGNLTITITNTGSDIQAGGVGEITGSGTNTNTAVPDLSFNITDPSWIGKIVYRVYYTPEGGSKSQVDFTYANFVVKILTPVSVRHALSSNEVLIDFTPPPAQCTEGNTQPCYTGSGGTEGVGQCHGGTQTCSGGQWGGCSGQVIPSTETCGNGIDDDCNGVVDETCASCTPGQTRSCYTGPSGTNGTGRCINGLQTCPSSGNWSLEFPACTGQITPASTDTCGNGIDDNCNGVIDEPTGQPDVCGNELDDNCNGQIDEGCVFCVLGQTRSCYTGPTGTIGVGVCVNGSQVCPTGGYWSPTWPSCSGQVTPSGTDTCANNLDDNCNGYVDEGCACVPGTVIPCGPANVGECHKGNQTCSPGGVWIQSCVNAVYPASEVCDGKDNNCNGVADDGLGNVTCGIGACYKSIAACSGGVPQTCTPGQPAANDTCGNGIDDNCDGVIDDGCGCVPKNETCNGIDDNCDTFIDNGIAPMNCSMYKGICSVGAQTCQGGAWTGCPFPQSEICNGLDDNCDGTVDEGCPCISGQNYTCGPANSTGECKLGNSACISGVFGNCTGAVYPAAETCDGKDNDCNGAADDSIAPVNCNLSKFGICAIGFESCANGTFAGCPLQQVETCNSIDDDCDGIVDNGCVCVPGTTQPCGPTTEAGICKKGIDTCVNGSWSNTCAGAVYPGTEACGNGVDEDCNGVDAQCAGCRSGAECDSGKCVNGNCLAVTFSKRESNGVVVDPGFVREERPPVTNIIPASVLQTFGIATEVKTKTCDVGTRCSTADDCYDSQCIDGTCACCVQTCVRSGDCCTGYCEQGRCKLPPSMAPFIIRKPGSMLSGCAGLIQECLPGEQGCISICNAMTFLLAIVGAGTMFAFWKTYKHPVIAIGSLAIPIALSIITYPFVGVIISLLMIGMLFAK